MTRYKIIGILNLFLGVFEVVYPLFVIIFTVPRLIGLYSDFNAKLPSLALTYLVLGLLVLMGIGNLFFGFNLIFESKKKEKYFHHALILVIVSFLLVGIFSGISILSAILPIYNLVLVD